MTIIPSSSRISRVNERLYHQSNLLGDWKGTWQKNHQPVELKIINVRGSQAQVEYTHNGRTERGLAKVEGATITFGNVTLGTKNGKVAGLEFSIGSAKMTAVLTKQNAPTDQNRLVGNWSGVSRENGQSAFFQVVSVNGRDAQVRFAANGRPVQSGAGIVYKNIVMFGSKAQITSDDGRSGHVVFQVGHKTYSVPVTKSRAQISSSSSVNKLV